MSAALLHPGAHNLCCKCGRCCPGCCCCCCSQGDWEEGYVEAGQIKVPGGELCSCAFSCSPPAAAIVDLSCLEPFGACAIPPQRAWRSLPASTRTRPPTTSCRCPTLPARPCTTSSCRSAATGGGPARCRTRWSCSRTRCVRGGRLLGVLPEILLAA
jgi:hypothetical protein